jgi:hypothetical protein
MKKVSFDFDGTLSRKDVQDYAKSLIKKGIDVWVTTSRYDEENKHKYPINPTNEDMYKVTDSLGIPREKIIFCNMQDKVDIMPNDFVWHLDDDWYELNCINKRSKIKGISVFGNSKWKIKCDKL